MFVLSREGEVIGPEYRRRYTQEINGRGESDLFA